MGQDNFKTCYYYLCLRLKNNPGLKTEVYIYIETVHTHAHTSTHDCWHKQAPWSGRPANFLISPSRVQSAHAQRQS